MLEIRNFTVQGLHSQPISQLLCTSGCGVRPGAPIITQAADGRLELLGLAVGGEDCTENYMRNQLNTDPPIYVDVFPYVNWIMNVISAFHIPKAYPHTFQLVDGGASEYHFILKGQLSLKFISCSVLEMAR